MFYSYCDSTPCAVRKKWHIKEDKDKSTCHVMACVMHGSFGTYSIGSDRIKPRSVFRVAKNVSNTSCYSTD